MRVLDYLIEKEIVKDTKEFQDLYAVRAFKINDNTLSDPNVLIDVKNIYKVQVGYRIINMQ